MRFELEHPDEDHVNAVYGHDHAIGFFVEIRVRDKPLLAYDNTHSGYRHLQGALDLLIEAEFFTSVDVTDAHQWLQHFMSAEIPDADSRRAAQVIENMRRAAGK